MDRAELARSLQCVADLYEKVVADWARRTGVPPPSSVFVPAVRDVLHRLVEGEGERLA
jgi:hypothetical protein